MLIVTSNDIPGFRIDAVLGEVMGITVRSANIGANFVAGLRAIAGGEVHEYTKLVWDSRQQVMQRMWDDAVSRGANAIIAMRFDTGDIAQQFSEVCAYGTAVVVVPLGEGEEGSTTHSRTIAAQNRGRGPAQGGFQPQGMATSSTQPSSQPGSQSSPQPYEGQQGYAQHGGQQGPQQTQQPYGQQGQQH